MESRTPSMRKSKFTEDQVVKILKGVGAETSVFVATVLKNILNNSK